MTPVQRDSLPGTTIVGAIVALCILAATAIVALTIVDATGRSTPAIATLVGLLAPTIVGLLALLRSERTEQKTKEIHRELDGRLETIEKAANVINNEHENPPG